MRKREPRQRSHSLWLKKSTDNNIDDLVYCRAAKDTHCFSQSHGTISFDDYVFGTRVFQQIFQYVETGNMPGWQNGKAPDYVKWMSSRVAASCHGLFS